MWVLTGICLLLCKQIPVNPRFASAATLAVLALPQTIILTQWKRLTVYSNGSMRTTSPAKSMIADLKSCLSIMKMSRQNYQRASLPKCSLMHQKAEQRDFRHAVLSKAINLSYAPLPARSLFLRRGCFYFWENSVEVLFLEHIPREEAADHGDRERHPPDPVARYPSLADVHAEEA